MVEGELEADRIFSELMGKDPAARYRFIMEQAPQAEAVELDVVAEKSAAGFLTGQARSG